MVDDALPSIRSLEAFEATVRLGSMTAAARELGRTQPAISQQIRSLEETLGGPLFNRHTGPLTPTREGLLLHQEVSPLLSSLNAAIQRTSSRFNRQVPEITIAANFGFTHLWLLPRLPLLQETFTDIRFSLVPDDSGSPTLSREADISITFDQQAPSASDEILLAEEVVFPVCSPAFAQAMGLGTRLTKQNLESCTLLHMDEQNRRWLDWSSWGIMAGYGAIHRYSGFAFNNYPLLLNAALDGQGLMLGWSALVEDRVEQGTLLAFEPQVTRAGYGYLLRSHKSRNTLVKPVIDWLVKQFTPMR